MSGIKRVRISVSRIYAALRLSYASKAGGRIPRGFAQLVDEAVADRIMTVASRTLISDCLMAMAADEDEVEQEGARPSHRRPGVCGQPARAAPAGGARLVDAARHGALGAGGT